MVILWLAAAYWAFRDMQLRTANPIIPYFAASLVIIFTPVFFPFAIVAYRIVRPQEKIGEVYERTLAEEALLAEVEAVRSCPTCARRVNEEWIICPTCRTRLNRVCPNCSRLVGLDWSLCAWCGRDFERAVPGFEAVAPTRPVPASSHRDPIQPPQPAFAPQPFSAAPEASSYRGPGSSVGFGGRDEPARDGAHRDLPNVTPGPVREASPQAMTGGSGGLAPGFDPARTAARSLDRAPQPPTATPNPPMGPSRTSRPALQRGGVKGPAKGPRPSTDALPER